VVIEALACGTPVVATDVGRVRQLIPSDEYGYIAPVNDAQALEEALKRSLNRRWDRGRIAEWGGRRGWGRVAEEVAAEARESVREAARAKDLKTVVVNADDLGMSRRVNEAIFQMAAGNRITSATLMANGPAIEDAARGLRDFPECSFGIHLNLTEFEPLTRGPGARLLTNAEGLLERKVASARPTPALLRAIHAELQAQVERLIALGVTISHIDSHHHVHTVPFVLPVVLAIQRRFGIRRIRISKNIYTERSRPPAALRAKKRLYNGVLRMAGETVEGFTDLATFREAGGSGRIRQRTIELMVHPGAPTSRKETLLLGSDWGDGLPFPLRRMSYREICNGRDH
jgi:predicted glycoside hydrolase/deacetylase ChbG (UPF0249 family)